MIKRVKSTKVGDVFVAEINDTIKKYMQLIAIDKSHLNSDVIRAFKKQYSIESEPSLEEIISDEVDFYIHAQTSAGIKFEFWKLVGNISEVGNVDNILFYGTGERINEFGVWENQWWVCRVNQEREYSSKPLKKYIEKRMYEDFIEPPFIIVDRLKGVFKSPTPEYK